MKNKTQKRIDIFSNILTNIGVEGKDKRLSTRISSNVLSKNTLRDFYESDDISKKIINREPDEMTREGFDLIIENDDKNISQQVQDQLDTFEIENKINDALKWARLFGGSILLLSVKGEDPKLPLDLTKKNKGLEYAVVLTKDEIKHSEELDNDPRSPNYRFPLYFEFNNEKIHYSRAIKFYGHKSDYQGLKKNQFWGKSLLENLYMPIVNYNSTHENLSLIVQDFIKDIYKIEDLIGMMSSEKSEELLKKRISLIAQKRSVLNAIIIDSKSEDFDSKSLNVTGLKELVDKIESRLVTGTDIPHTILFGEGPDGGIGTEGNSEKMDWYDHIKNQQEKIYRPGIEKVIDIILMNIKGKIPLYTLTFRPLWQPTQQQVLNSRKSQSEIDEKYYGMGVVTTEEIRQSRFANGDYSFETKLLESQPITENLQ